MSPELKDQFFKHVKEEGECHIWQRHTLYVWDRSVNRYVLARNVAWEIQKGEAPTTGFLTTCGNDRCVNPDHFIAKNKRGRNPLGETERKERRKASKKKYLEKIRGLKS